jgi:hypothetical protein
MAIADYTDNEYLEDPAPALSMDPNVATAWQFDDEIEYHTQLAISYPQDAKAKFAAWWLRRYAA